jgi:hypothetical protein
MQNLTAQEEIEYWRKHIAQFVASNKSQRNYCKSSSINYGKFKTWRYKLSDEFPVNQEHPRAKNNKAKSKAAIKSKTVATNVGNKFAAVEIIKDHPGHEMTAQPIKLYLNKYIYLELPNMIDVNNLQKIFNALGVL